jgi:hypothetical protein
MFTSSEYVSGILTLVACSGESFDINWEAPLDDPTFNSVSSDVLEHSKTLGACFDLPLREYLAENVLAAYLRYTAGPDDPSDPQNIEADNQLKVWLRLFSDEVGSPNFTFYVADGYVEHIDVEPLPSPEEIAKVLGRAPMMLESTKNDAEVL